MELCDFDPPKNWEEFVSLKEKIAYCIPEATRFPDDLFFYDQYTRLVPREIRFKILDLIIGDNKTKLVRNNFPYHKLIQHLGKVTHYCLWSKSGSLTPEQIETEINNKFPGSIHLWFENVLETKSIPEIWHCHIFVKKD